MTPLPISPPDRPESAEHDRPAGSLPCLCRVLAVSLLGDFRRPAGFRRPDSCRTAILWRPIGPPLNLHCRYTAGILITHRLPTHHPHITHSGRFPSGGPATRPSGPRGTASTRVWQPPPGRCIDDVTRSHVHLPHTIARRAAPRKGKFGSCVQVVAVIEA